MAGKSAGPGLFGNWPVWAIFLVVGTYFINTGSLPFQGSRPAASGTLQRSLAETQDVDARLWQDPFEAVRKDVEARASAKQKSGCHDGPSCLALASDGNTLILGVMLPGSSYSESEELRRQIRYAVLSSLGTQHYGPLDSEHIGYFPFRPDSSDMPEPGAKCPTPAATATNIAYEEFAPPSDNANTTKLFVFWLNEDDLLTITKSCPLWGLSAIQRALQKLSSRTTIQFLGPASSSTLQSMIAEVSQDVTCKPRLQANAQANPRNLTLYNFLATVAERELQTADCQDYAIGDFFHAAGISYYRTIADDARLADFSICELARRGVPMACDSQDRVVLVSEWDTAYGRTFREGIRNAYQKKYGCASEKSSVRFLPVSYMRGLDGQLPQSQARRSNGDAGDNPGDAAANRQAPGTEQVLSLYAASPKIERAEGNGQYDYVRRLAMSLVERVRAKNETVSAIGVVGSDVYDKLAVLQQLHPQFPGAIFFTTDLDARLYHPAQAEWARNLIVASSYDLELDPELQGEIPPFRAGYQTAAFLTTRLILEDQGNAICRNNAACCLDPEYRKGPELKALKDPACSRELLWAGSPKLFQIPYRRLFAYPLQTDAANSNGKAPSLRARASVARSVPGLFPTAFHQNLSSRVAGSFLLGCLFFGVSLSFSRTFRAAVFMTPITKHDARRKWWMLGVLALIMVGLPLLLIAFNQPSAPLAVNQPLLWIGASSVAGIAALRRRVVHADSKPKAWVGYVQRGLAVVLCGCGGALYYLYWPSIGATLTSNGDGEPILLLSGISMWPSLAIRLFAIALCIKFIGDVIRQLDANLIGLAKDFGLSKPAYTADGIVDAAGHSFCVLFAKKRRLRMTVWARLPDIFCYRLRGKAPQRATGKEPSCEVRFLWRNYRRYGSAPARFFRIGAIAFACVALQVVLYMFTGEWPQVVGRGDVVRNAAYITFWVETILLWILVVYVADATIFCLRFIREMQRFRSLWPPPGRAPYEVEFDLTGKPVAEWMDIEFVGKRTDCIAKLILYPFLVLTLLILAQSSLLDDMPRDWPRLIEMGAAFGVILFCAVMLPREAQKLRDVALARLSQDGIALRGRSAQNMERLKHRIEDYRVGAFTPLPQQPIVQAVLYPLSGLGGTALLQYFALPGL